MSQARIAKFFTRPSRTTLFVMIGAQHIECGVMRGSGSSAQWVKDSLVKHVIEEFDGIESPMLALTAAIQRLPLLLSLSSVDAVRVVVADCWLAVAGVPWSQNLKRTANADTFARTQLSGAGFEIDPADTLKLDDAPFESPRLTVAYPTTLLTALNYLADHLNGRLISILPLSVAAWGLALRQRGVRPQALAVLDNELMMFGYVSKGRHPRLTDVSVRRSASGSALTDQHLREVWQRLCLRDPSLAEMGQVALLDLTCSGNSKRSADQPFVLIDLPPQVAAVSPSGVTPGLHLAANAGHLRHILDAMSNASTPLPGRWLALGAAVLFAAIMILQAVDTRQSVESLSSLLAAATNATQHVARPSSWNREEITRVKAVNAAIRELNMPISSILRALEPPRDIRVAVLSVETGAGSSSTTQVSNIKIVAEARTSAEMARYVGVVSERKPFTGAYLTEHEIDKTSAEQSYRFTVEAPWSE